MFESSEEMIFCVYILLFKNSRRLHQQILRVQQELSLHFSHIAFTLYLDFSARRSWRENGSRQERRGGREQSGAHWSLNIPVLNMKIYYSIMCSVCKLEGNHMKRSQTKSLLCSKWPPLPPPSFVCFNWQREREGEREGRGKKGEVCVQSQELKRGSTHTRCLTQPDPPEYRWAAWLNQHTPNRKEYWNLEFYLSLWNCDCCRLCHLQPIIFIFTG